MLYLVMKPLISGLVRGVYEIFGLSGKGLERLAQHEFVYHRIELLQADLKEV